MSGKYNAVKYIIRGIAACALCAAGGVAAAADVPGTFDEASRVSADIKPDQVKTGLMASFTPVVKMRAVETRLLINGEWRTIIRYIPCEPERGAMKGGQSSPNSPASMKTQSKTANDRLLPPKGPEPASKPGMKKKRKTALHKIVQETPATTDWNRQKE